MFSDTIGWALFGFTVTMAVGGIVYGIVYCYLSDKKLDHDLKIIREEHERRMEQLRKATGNPSLTTIKGTKHA